MSMSTRPSYYSLTEQYVFSANHFMSIYSSTLCTVKNSAPLGIANCNVFFEPKLKRGAGAAACCAVNLYLKKCKAGQTLEDR